jgi:hypothetical protein
MLSENLANPTQHLTDLILLVGSADEIAPVDDVTYAKRAGEIIARAVATMRPRTARRRMRLPTPQIRKGEPALVSAVDGAGSAMLFSVVAAI